MKKGVISSANAAVLVRTWTLAPVGRHDEFLVKYRLSPQNDYVPQSRIDKDPNDKFEMTSSEGNVKDPKWLRIKAAKQHVEALAKLAQEQTAAVETDNYYFHLWNAVQQDLYFVMETDDK